MIAELALQKRDTRDSLQFVLKMRSENNNNNNNKAITIRSRSLKSNEIYLLLYLSSLPLLISESASLATALFGSGIMMMVIKGQVVFSR